MRRIVFLLSAGLSLIGTAEIARAQDILPKHVTPQAQAAIKKGTRLSCQGP